MNRLDFLKRLGLGAVAAVAAPTAINAIIGEREPVLYQCDLETGEVEVVEAEYAEGYKLGVKEVEDICQYPMTYDECYRFPIDPAMEELVKKCDRLQIFDLLTKT